MNTPRYRVFVCTKQRSLEDPKGCYNCGAMEIYQAFEHEINQRQLQDVVEVKASGCLDHCEAGAVALVYQPKKRELLWLPKKLRRLFLTNKHWYGKITSADVPEIVESHFIKAQPLNRCRIGSK